MTRAARTVAMLLLAGTASVALAASEAKPAASGTKLPPFAAQLAELPRAAPGERPAVDVALGWSMIARSTSETRQAARWKLATALLDQGRGAEAIAILETMRRDDAALDMVPAWRLAAGIANVLNGRADAALIWFNTPELAVDPEACAWRLRAGAAVDGAAGGALLRCAIPAMLARRGTDRAPFLLAAAAALTKSGHPARALHFLAPLPDQHAAANLERGLALLATGQRAAGRLRLERVLLSGAPGERAAAELALVRDGAEHRLLTPRAAIKRIDALTFRWRGGPIERAALDYKWSLAERTGDPVLALAASAALFRHFDLGDGTGTTLQRIQTGLQALIDEEKRPVAEAAGLFWEYRDLAPTGAAGDLLVSRLADRLSSVGLHARAAELLHYQMTARAVDIAKGPLSIRIARLLLLANKADEAIAMLRQSDGPDYPEAIAGERRRMQAIATYRAGRRGDAVAMLDQLPKSDDLRAEMLWQARDWSGFVEANRLQLAGGRNGAVLRQAIALILVGDEAGLAALRQRHGPALRGSRAGEALEALATPSGAVNPAALDVAMAGLTDSPTQGDLLLLTES